MKPLIHSSAGPVPGDAPPSQRRRVGERTKELARLAGRVPPQVDQSDYEQAKLEVTGERDGDRQDEILDSPVKRRSSGQASKL